MKDLRIKTIVSGGQTGADRAALDFALERGLQIAGFVPRGRRAEDGRIDEKYAGLVETVSARYGERTELNVRQADATLIVSHGELTGGSRLTAEMAARFGKPFLHLDLSRTSTGEAAARARLWVHALDCETLNVAGPRASEDREIYEKTKDFLRALFGGG